MPTPVVRRPELVGDVIEHLIGERPTSVVLRGPAGIGKSHLATDVVEQLADGSAGGGRSPSLRRLAGGVALRSLPFGAMLHLLSDDDGPVSVEFELVQRLRSALVEHGASRRVVVVDDVGLLDEKSAGLLESIVRAGDVLVLATERTPLTGPPHEHQLSSMLRTVATTIEMPPMPDDDLAELIIEWQGPGEVGSVRRIAAMSRGNPLVARELLSSARAAGAIEHDGGLWHLNEFAAAGDSIERLVHEHLHRLSETQWDLMRCVSVASSLPRTVAARMDLDALERLERSQLLVGDPVVVGHPLYGEVTRAAMTGEQLRSVCRKLINTVGPDDDVDAARLGDWLLQAEDAVDDDIARRGAARAIGRWENELARRLLDTIREPGVGDLVLRVWALANDGRIVEAADVAETAVEAASNDVERVDAGLARAELWCLQMQRAPEAYDALLALRDDLTDPDLIARVDGATTLYSHMTGNRELADRAAQRAADSPLSSDEARVSVVLGEAFAKVFTGRFAAAKAAIEEGLELAGRLDAPHNVVRFEVAEAIRRMVLGDLDGCSELIDEMLRDADVSGVRPAHVVWLGLASQVAQLRGQFDVAERRDREAVRVADHVDDFGSGGFVRGDLSALEIEFDHTADMDPRSSPIGMARARVRVAPAADADALAHELASDTMASGYVVWAPWIAREGVRRGPAPRCAELLEELAGQIEGPVVASMALHARGLIERDVEATERAARTFLEHGCVMPAIDAGLDAAGLAAGVGPSVELRRALLEFAEVVALVTPSVPPRIAARFDDLVDRADMPSARQLEIATMAAAGLSSKEIAADLVVSVRTVDNHLAAVYRSLGVSSRHELATLSIGRHR